MNLCISDKMASLYSSIGIVSRFCERVFEINKEQMLDCMSTTDTLSVRVPPIFCHADTKCILAPKETYHDHSMAIDLQHGCTIYHYYTDLSQLRHNMYYG